MNKLVQLGLRSSQILLTLITTALIGNVIHEAFAGNPSSINYAILVCVLAWIVTLYGLGAAFKEDILVPIVIVTLDGVATTFTLIAGVVLAANLGVHSCRNSEYVLGNSLTNGSHSPSKRCHELQAATAFFWFLFASFTGSTVMDIISGGTQSLRVGRIFRGAPTMSQV